MGNEVKLEYIQISLSFLKKFAHPLRFDIYVQRTSTNYTKIFKKGDLIDWDRVQQYIEKGINYFYVTEADYQIYTLFVERLGDVLVDSIKKFSPEEAMDVLKELVSFTITEMAVKLNTDERMLTNAGNAVMVSIQSLNEDPKSVLTILGLLSQHAYIVKHSIATSLFSVLLAQHSGFESESNLNLIGMGAFLHDVGVGQLTFDPDDIKILTPEQRKEVWRHPELGKEQLDNIKGIRTEVIQIVMQHHEQPNGHGYPNGLKSTEIYPPAKIVAIADAFSAMISKRSFRDAFTVQEALASLRDAVGKYDSKLLDIFCKLLLPKPSL